MLFKFSFIPDVELTREKILARYAPNQLTLEEVEEETKETFRHIHNSEYNVFIRASNMSEAFAKLASDWLTDEDCLLTHQAYKDIVMGVAVECVDVTDNEPALLNALVIIN